MTFDAAALAALERTVEWAQIPWNDAKTALLERYADWLGGEGLELGGLGPDELPRLWRRHLLDSLLLGAGYAGDGSLCDVGTGVGLPGIPLAIAFPKSRVVLLDRSGRRTDAVRRAAAVLDLAVEVVQADVTRYDEVMVDRVVMRAALPPNRATRTVTRLLHDGGEAWIALGWEPSESKHADWKTISAPVGWVAHLVEVPAEILDSPVWMLRIART